MTPFSLSRKAPLSTAPHDTAHDACGHPIRHSISRQGTSGGMPGWVDTIREARTEDRALLTRHPSLRPRFPTALARSLLTCLP